MSSKFTLSHMIIAVAALLFSTAAANAPEKYLAQQIAAVAAQAKAEQAAKIIPQPPVVAGTAAAAQATVTSLTASITSATDGFNISYPWGNIVPAATFQRGEMVWVVFGAPITVQHVGLEGVSGHVPLRAISTPASDATILQYKIERGQQVGMSREGSVWTLAVRRTPVLPRQELQPQPTDNPIRGVEQFFAAADPGNIVTITDPVGQGSFIVALLSQSSAGVFKNIDAQGATILASAQGIAITVTDPHKVLVRYSDGVALATLAPIRAQAPGSSTSEAASTADPAPQRIIDLVAWSEPHKESYSARKADLLHSLSVAPLAERQSARWTLAKYLLGNGMAPDALGVLGLMARLDKNLPNTPQFRVVRGIAALQARQYSLAHDDLWQLALDGDGEIWLWRAVLAEIEGQPRQALDAYAHGVDVIGRYGPDERARFQLAAIRAAMRLGDLATARHELNLFPQDNVAIQRRAEANYWRGKLALLDNKPTEAAAQFALVLASGDRKASAMAMLTQAQDDLLHQRITPVQAIDRLERMRFAWRGDSLELELLDTLGGLHASLGNYRDALSIFRQGTTYFQPSEQTNAIAAKMTALFRRLFLEGGADKIPPVQAVALYKDFEELTPLGTDGDAMIRLISERLVDLGLYERASGLLEHQVQYRLEGTAQALVAARLATIDILASKPERALQTLRATRQQLVPDDVRIERNRVEARALLDLGRVEEAAAVIDGDTSPAADLLHADIDWRGRSWRPLLATTERLLASPAPLLSTNDRVKLAVRAALAYALLGDNDGAARFRQRYGALTKGTIFASAFETLTSGAAIGKAEINSLSKVLASVDSLDAPKAAAIMAFKTAAVSQPVSAKPAA